MDLVLIEIFFEGQTRNMTNTKNDEKSKNFIKICFLLCGGLQVRAPLASCLIYYYAGGVYFVFALEGLGSNPARRRNFKDTSRGL